MQLLQQHVAGHFHHARGHVLVNRYRRASCRASVSRSVAPLRFSMTAHHVATHMFGFDALLLHCTGFCAGQSCLPRLKSSTRTCLSQIALYLLHTAFTPPLGTPLLLILTAGLAEQCNYREQLALLCALAGYRSKPMLVHLAVCVRNDPGRRCSVYTPHPCRWSKAIISKEHSGSRGALASDMLLSVLLVPTGCCPSICEERAGPAVTDTEAACQIVGMPHAGGWHNLRNRLSWLQQPHNWSTGYHRRWPMHGQA